MKNKIVGIFVCTLIVTSLGQALEKKDIGERNECLTFDFSFSEPKLEKINVKHGIYDRVTIDDLPNTHDYGRPCLPVKPLRVLLPQGRDLENIEVLSSGKISLGIDYNIEVGGKLVPLTNNQIISEDNVVESSLQKINCVLTSQNLYSNIGVHIFRGYKILHVNLYPVQYVENTGELYYYKDLKLIVETKKASITGGFRGLQKDCDIIKKIVDNPSYISTYSDHVVNKLGSDETYSYIIITSESFKNAAGEYTFQDLIESKIDRGMTAGIFTVEEIVDNPDYSVDGLWGDNNPDNPFYEYEINGDPNLFNDKSAKIRNFIRFAYMEWGTDYILLGGDADPESSNDNIVPLRGLFANESGLPLNNYAEEEDDIPSDVYYACLDGNFNYDCDEHFGECADRNDLTMMDEADLYSEVWVGRASVDSEDEIYNFVMKTLKYEQYTDISDFDDILFVGEHLGSLFYYPYGGYYKDDMEHLVPPQYNLHKFYDYDHPENDWHPEELAEEIYSIEPHMINHDGHGYVTYMFKTGSYFFYELTNEKPFFVYSHSCLTGSFDNWAPYGGYGEDDCIAEILTCEIPYGAFACILNARYGLGSEDSPYAPSGAYDESFYKALFTENIKELGRASHYSKEDNVWRIDENGYRWCYYQTNLFGDPELKIRDLTEKPDKPSKPSGPANGEVGTEYTYTSSTTDPDGDQVYYWFEWGDGTNSGWIGPLVSGATGSAKHKWASQGNYQIKVKAKDTANIESEWSDPLSVSIPKSKPYINTSFLKFLKNLMQRFPLLARLLQLSVFEKLIDFPC